MFACAAFLTITINASDSSKKVAAVETIDELNKSVMSSGSQLVLVNVWAPGCSPCMAEMPVLAKLAKVLGSKSSVSFLGLCIPSDPTKKKAAVDTAETILKKKDLPYRNLVWVGKEDALLDRFNIQGTPYTVLLSSSGETISVLDVPTDPAKAEEYISAEIQKALARIPNAKPDSSRK